MTTPPQGTIYPVGSKYQKTTTMREMSHEDAERLTPQMAFLNRHMSDAEYRAAILNTLEDYAATWATCTEDQRVLAEQMESAILQHIGLSGLKSVVVYPVNDKSPRLVICLIYEKIDQYAIVHIQFEHVSSELNNVESMITDAYEVAKGEAE